MKINDFDLDKDVLVVAEIGNNHEGSYALAEEMVGLAAKAGAGAVKFQTFQTEYYVGRKNEARFRQLKSFELTYVEFEKLSKVASSEGILFLSTPFDLESAEFLNTIVPAFKISSGDINFYPLLEIVARCGKPIILSTGAANMVQIRSAKGFIEEIWRDLGVGEELAVLHCVSSYPVPVDEANLGVILTLKRELKCTIGYSDHTPGVEAAALAVALGARVVEKHFTINKNHSGFRDHRLSADPEEMAQLTQRIKETLSLLGTGEKVLQNSEQEAVNSTRRSIVAKRDLPEGKVITPNDITWIRPAGGLPPGKEHLVLDKYLSAPVKMGEPLVPDILREKEKI